MIEMVSVSKVYKAGSRPAVSEVNLHVNQGEFVFLVGPSGAGKTTLIEAYLPRGDADGRRDQISCRETAAYKSGNYCFTGGRWALFFRITGF